MYTSQLLTLVANVLLLLSLFLFHAHQMLNQILVFDGVRLVDQGAHNSIRLELKALLLRHLKRRIMLQRVMVLAMKLERAVHI